MSRPFNITPGMSLDSPLTAGKLMCRYPDVMLELFGDNSFRQWLSESDPELAAQAIQAFSKEEDEQLGLFKASYVLAPAHPLTFMGEEFPKLSDLGYKILNDAPRLFDPAFRLFDSSALVWYLKMQRANERNPELFNAVQKLFDQRKSHLEVSYFLLGYLLTKETRFFFDGKVYQDILEFFAQNSSNTELMSSFDFITAPYSIAYHVATGQSQSLGKARSLSDANASADAALNRAKKRR